MQPKTLMYLVFGMDSDFLSKDYSNGNVISDYSTEEAIVLNGNELHIYHDDKLNPNPNRSRLWNDACYSRNKMTWNRSSN